MLPLAIPSSLTIVESERTIHIVGCKFGETGINNQLAFGNFEIPPGIAWHNCSFVHMTNQSLIV
jgi:hypothetical protein